MTFSITVPNASQSPGLFPAQNNINFQRIKDIVNAEHDWTDSSSTSQGLHKQATFINRTDPGSIPAGNGILYSKNDSDGASQLHWYNGSVNYQITPIADAPLKVTGSVALAGSATSGSVYSVPENTQGTIFVNYILPAGTLWRYYLFYRSGSSIIDISLISASAGTSRPDVSISGSNLLVVNGNSAARTVGYWINTVSF